MTDYWLAILILAGMAGAIVGFQIGLLIQRDINSRDQKTMPYCGHVPPRPLPKSPLRSRKPTAKSLPGKGK